MAEGHYDKNGTHYVFGFITDKGFAFVPHRFHLYTDGDITRGQFLTSLWFSINHRRKYIMTYIIVGLQGSFKYSELTDAVNKSYREHGTESKENSPESGEAWYDCISHPDIVFCDIFSMGAEITEGLFNNGEKGQFIINLDGEGRNTKLLFSAEHITSCIYVTLPEFAIGP